MGPALITFYDIPSSLTPKAWSPHTWKTRYSLNYKGIPYQTVWIDYPDIAALCREIGAEPTSIRADGTPYYSLPVIKDELTGAVVSNSFDIAVYLDKAYPSTPTPIPAGTHALQKAFETALMSSLKSLFMIGPPSAHAYLTPHSQVYFRESREKTYGKKLEEISPVGSSTREEHIEQLKAGFDTLNDWLDQNGKRHQYVMGDTVSFADIILVGFMSFLKAVAPEAWASVATWNEGRWEAYLDGFKEYTTVA